jgi:uncharacterized protein (TIGR04255 family)
MNSLGGFRIDTTEHFAHLPGAPIQEAVIGVGAHVKSPWDEREVRDALKTRLDDYVYLDSLRVVEIEGRVEPGKQPIQSIRDKGWKGHRVKSSDAKHVAQFNRDGFVFSRLKPYEDWERFVSEAMRLWQVFREMAKPEEVGRLGLRYINRFPLTPNERDVENYLLPAPQTPRGVALVLGQFLHHDLLNVPEHPYAVRVVRTLQEPQSRDDLRCHAILDIDAFTEEAFEPDDGALMRRLEDLRWLKNKVFFGSITDKALAAFKEEPNGTM